MAADTAARRLALVGITVPSRRATLPTGADYDLQSERLAMVGVYGGFPAAIGSISTSSGARQRDRRVGLLGRV